MIFRRLAIVLLAGLLLWQPAYSAAQDTSDNVTVHVVQRGETLYRIAQQYNLTIEAIASFNNIADPTNIQVGQRLLIPLSSSSQPEIPFTHVVQAGENLKSIATLYGLTVEELANRNNITDVNRIFVGQILNIKESAPATPSPSPIPTVKPAPSQDTSAEVPNLLYTVKGGDTLFRIATRYGLTVNDLVRANNVADPTVIYSGQQLIIPGVKPPESAFDLPANVSHIDVTPQMFVEGETGQIRLTTTVPMIVNGTFLNQSLSAATDQNGTVDIILIGVPVFTDAGVYPLAISLTDASGQVTPLDLNIQVLSGGYGRESITLLSNRADLVDPVLEDAESKTMHRLMSNFTPTRYFNGPLSLPAAASISSPFGRKRSYDGGPFDHYHTGTDFAAAPGSPVMAAAPGYVVFADKLDVRGNATIIDHGWGIYTVYCHQTAQYVKVGDFVNTGQVIGTVGSTGRVTGPHLHWEVWVNGVQVDPMQWVQESFHKGALMPNEKVKRLLGRFRNQDNQPTVDSHPTQRARPRSEFSWNDLKVNLKMLLVKSNALEALYEELLIPSLSGQFDKELYVRWLQSVCLIPFFQENAVSQQFLDSNIYFALQLRQTLIPYLQSVVALSRDYKWPMLKSLDKVEPENPKTRGIDDCYLLGGTLLVAPVMAQGAAQRYVYLPAGHWYNYWSNHSFDGSQYVAIDAPLQLLPIFVRAGTILPLHQDSLKDDPDANKTLIYRVYPGNQETVLYEDDSEGFDKERGQYRWIYITCAWQEEKLIINRRIAGQYDPDYTHIRVEIIGLEHEPLRIRIDHRPAPLWFFDEGILEFTTDTFQIIEILMVEEFDNK